MMVALATLSLVACGAPSTTDFVQKAAMSDMYEVAGLNGDGIRNIGVLTDRLA